MATRHRDRSGPKRHRAVQDDGPYPKRMKKSLEPSGREEQPPDLVNNEGMMTPDGSNSDIAKQSKTSSHSKKERKNNRSSRIHSLRKQLARGSLPQTVHQEKERELAALLHGQEKDKVKQQSKKNLQKYHYVRFLERQKAEKKLKKLRLQLERGDADGDLEDRIHEMEVDLNYAIYAPLGQKYISVFPKSAKTDSGGKEGHEVAHKRNGNFTDATQDHDKDMPHGEEISLATKVKKPALWYEVEKAMEQGQSHLEALRDGRGSKLQIEKPKSDEKTRANEKQDRSQKASHTTTRSERGSKPASQGRDSAVSLQETDSSDDEDISDGGFFER